MDDTDLSDERIRLAFFFALGRYPENEQVIEQCRNLKTIESLRNAIESSFEFKLRVWKMARNFVAARRLGPAIALAGSAPPESHQSLLILQTCDNRKYIRLLEQTARTVLKYIEGTSIKYDVFIGLKKGYHPHHAMFNRIYKLNEYIDAGLSGWILYMDADAYICDMSFNVTEYLADKGNYAFIVSKVSDDDECPSWNINDGVFFANLTHPVCRYVIKEWYKFYDSIYHESDYANASRWDDIINDQTSLHDILQTPHLDEYIDSTNGNANLFNSADGRFIRQVLRDDHQSANDDSFDKRLAQLTREVDRALTRNEG